MYGSLNLLAVQNCSQNFRLTVVVFLRSSFNHEFISITDVKQFPAQVAKNFHRRPTIFAFSLNLQIYLPRSITVRFVEKLPHCNLEQY